MNQSTLSIRVDSNDKKCFELFCDKTGMNVSTAINMFIKAVLREQKLPFEVKVDNMDNEIYNKLSEADQELKNKSNKYTTDEIIESVNKYFN